MEDTVLMLLKEKSCKEISELLNIKIWDVRKIAKTNGFVFKKLSKYSLDINYFDVIDTEDKAYFLGFLYADGNVGKNKNTISIVLSEKDLQILEDFKKYLKTNKPIYNVKGKYSINHKETKKVKIEICNEHFHKSLIKLNVFPNKSLSLTFPDVSIVPEHLIRHFIRGFFDGDGTIYKPNTSNFHHLGFISTLEMCQSLQKILNSGKIYKENRLQNKNVYYLKIFKKKDVERVCNFMYENANVFLKRKHEKYLNFLDIKVQRLNGESFK